jgi:IS5 family transposase
MPKLLQGDERKVWGDAAYQGRARRCEPRPHAHGNDLPPGRYERIVNRLQLRKNRTKAQVRSKVEHMFRVMKRQFAFDRVRYRGLAKNANSTFACFAVVNLYLSRKRLFPLARETQSRS